MKAQTEALAKALGVVGLMNVQYAVKEETVYILEVNPRASRTVPFVAKATGVPIAKIGARVMAGEKLADFDLSATALRDHIAVKEAVFPFRRFPGVDVILGPEMKSTGEVMGLDVDFAHAFAKAQFGCGADLPTTGTVFVSVKDSDKQAILEPSRIMVECGLTLLATGGTARFLEENDVPVRQINKVLEGQPHIVDAIINGEVQLIFNTTEGRKALEDSFSLREAALAMGVPYYTTAAGVRAAALAIRTLKQGTLEVAPLQSYFKRSA
jgi:carbamoyl-phosphate synthase large subunit